MRYRFNSKSNRNFDDPEYKKWRKKIFARDKYKCKHCGSSGKLQAHHIKKWASFPELRFDVNNGITLCRHCHGLIFGKEEQYEQLFLTLIGKQYDHEFYNRLNAAKKKNSS